MVIYAAVFLLGSVVQAQQGLYKVWFEGVTPCGSGLDSLVDVSSIKASHYNRTTLTIQGNLNMLQTVDEKTKMRLIALSKNSHGTWTKSMVDTNVVTVCEFIKTYDHLIRYVTDETNRLFKEQSRHVDQVDGGHQRSDSLHGTWTKSMVDTNVVTVCEFIKTDDQLIRYVTDETNRISKNSHGTWDQVDGGHQRSDSL
ncbi:uncharacterized protein LOC124370785 [Homalodisca vitripennis]|uniref:uncharacterized protein LOC124370785 n=1 Tax=Homalodisca vitripennis TaxID=197043 RepID=UPI001EEB98C3|nr:uncharacterized protein LOC124370785 [Homalodisca vitripennis]